MAAEQGPIPLHCERAKSYITPCVLRDGQACVLDDGTCAGCGVNVGNELQRVATLYSELKGQMEALRKMPGTPPIDYVIAGKWIMVEVMGYGGSCTDLEEVPDSQHEVVGRLLVSSTAKRFLGHAIAEAWRKRGER